MNSTTQPFNKENQNITGKEFKKRFEVRELIGRGGFGEVLKAFDCLLKREVAIKRIRPNTVATNAQQKLIKEAQICSQLEHKNIIQVYDIFIIDNQPHLILEYIDGNSLHQELDLFARRGEWLGPDEAVDIFLQILEGLHFAHTKGVVHMDIKPGNILLTKSKTVKIGDFGLARYLSPDSSDTNYIRTRLCGTPFFMSPEQARGGKIDWRTDIFSAGIVGYILFTSTHPFAHPSTVPSIVEMIMDENFEAPRSNLDKSSLTERFTDVIDRMLKKDLARRYSSLEEVRDELQAGAGRYCPDCHSSVSLEHRYCGFCGLTLPSLSKEQHTKVTSEPSGRAELLVGRGLDLLREEPRDWLGALRFFEEALAEDPACIPALKQVVKIRNRRHDYDGAIEVATEGLALDISDETKCALLDARGLARSHLKRYAGALDDFSKALSIDANDPKIWSHRAESLALLGDLEKAYEDVLRALELSPTLFVAKRLKKRLEKLTRRQEEDGDALGGSED